MDFIRQAMDLVENGNVDGALDVIYDHVDKMMREGQFEEIDRIVAGLKIEELDSDILIGVLTTTGWAKSKIPARGKFFDDVKKALEDRGCFDESNSSTLLDGLEQDNDMKKEKE